MAGPLETPSLPKSLELVVKGEFIICFNHSEGEKPNTQAPVHSPLHGGQGKGGEAVECGRVKENGTHLLGFTVGVTAMVDKSRQVPFPGSIQYLHRHTHILES